MNFAIIGIAGYVAPRHLRAIRDTQHRVVAALDPNDSVGILDSFDLDIAFFKEPERFDRHLEKLRQDPAANHVHYVSVCSPNYLHDAHCRMAMRVGADVICEKPLVINPWNLDLLQEVEHETGKRINVVLQLREHPALLALKEKIDAQPGKRHQVVLTYITARGKWYHYSWKGVAEKSGGVAINIGVHFFDLLGWLFGPVHEQRLYCSDDKRVSGFAALEKADVTWYLSVDKNDLPFEPIPGERTTYRSINVDGEEVEFTKGFTDLHTRVYERALGGQGYGIDDIRLATQWTYDIRHAPILSVDDQAHSLLRP
ncbi:MAG: Gfo/Idh/MocA family oxidoreductase [Anaerolineales bacterium]